MNGHASSSDLNSTGAITAPLSILPAVDAHYSTLVIQRRLPADVIEAILVLGAIDALQKGIGKAGLICVKNRRGFFLRGFGIPATMAR